MITISQHRLHTSPSVSTRGSTGGGKLKFHWALWRITFPLSSVTLHIDIPNTMSCSFVRLLSVFDIGCLLLLIHVRLQFSSYLRQAPAGFRWVAGIFFMQWFCKVLLGSFWASYFFGTVPCYCVLVPCLFGTSNIVLGSQFVPIFSFHQGCHCPALHFGFTFENEGQKCRRWRISFAFKSKGLWRTIYLIAREYFR